MKMIKMSYKGCTLDVNPRTISAEMKKSVAVKPVPFFHGRVQEVCSLPMVISGEGSFIGKDAEAQAFSLMRLFKSKGSAYLFAPCFSPVRAYFTELKLFSNAEKGCVDYTFRFVEDCQNKNDKIDFGFTYALGGENLYDIANRTGVPVETLFQRNDYKDLFCVTEGDKVWLN